MEENSEKVIEKIKKIMELATRGSTDAEKDTAMLQAQKLLDKYNLSMADIQDKDPDKKYTESDELYASWNSSYIERSVTDIIQNFYNVQIIIYSSRARGRHLKIFGQKHNVQVASYMHPWLMSEFENRWLQYKYDNGLKGAKYKNTFYSGIYHGLKEKLKKQREELMKEYSGSTDLAVLDETGLILNWLKESMNIREGKAKSIDIKDAGIQRDGYVEGLNMNLNQQVEA